MLFHGLRAAKAGQVNENLRARGAYLADQGFLWEELSRKASRMKTYSPTGAMADIYEGKRGMLSEYIEKFSAVSDQVGAIFMVNGKVAGMDAFGKAGAFEKVFGKLVGGYALDALTHCDDHARDNALKSQVTRFISSAKSASSKEHPSVGLGVDCRLESRSIIGFALVLDDKVIHISIFKKTGNGGTMGRNRTSYA